MTAGPKSAERDDDLRRIERTIAKHGVAVASRPPRPGCSAAYAYTVGLTAHRHPELLIFGIPSPTAHTTLNWLARQVIHDGATIGAGSRQNVLGSRTPVTVVNADHALAADYVTVPYVLYGSAHVSVRQVCYPDARGRYQWQDGSNLRRLPLLTVAP